MKHFANLTLVVAALVALAGCHQATSTPPVPRMSLSQVHATGDSVADKLIARAKKTIEAAPNQALGYNKLGLALMQKGRETSDLDNYNAALTAFEKATQLAPKDSEALHNLAWCWTMFHKFHKAMDLAQQAIAINPNDHFAYGVVADSHFELGQYDKAADAVQKMVDLRPNLASYSRAAQIRWMMGDAKGASVLWQRAINAGGPYAENSAWCRTQLGDTYWKTGAYSAAKQQYEAVLTLIPTYRHAHFGLGRVLRGEGDFEGAAKEMAQAVEGNPPLTYVIEYAQLLASMGKTDESQKQFARIELAVQEHLKHGIEGDEVALAEYYLATDTKIDEALALMETEVKEHTSLTTYSALAWSYYKSNQFAKAKVAIDAARKIGAQEAVVWMRASKIEAALGQPDAAKKLELAALNLNPRLDVAHCTPMKVAMGN